MVVVRERAGRPGALLVVMCVGMFLVLLDVTVVNVALPAIADGLAGGRERLQWVVDGYAVAIASLLLGAGSVGDRIGHRRVVLLGLALFGLASAGAAAAPDAAVLVAARGVQGIGAALLLPGSLALIADAYPDRGAQARALGIWAGVSSLALPAGPLLGGLLVGAGGWRLVFLVNLPVVAGALVAVPLVAARGVRRPGRSPDLAGMALAAATLAGLVYAVIEAGHRGFGPATVAAAVVALCAGAGFLVRQRLAAAPTLPLGLLARPAFTGPNLAALLMNLTFNGVLYALTLYLQGVLGWSAPVAGLSLLPLFLPLALLAPLAGRCAGRFGPRPVLVAGAAIAAAGVAALAVLARVGPAGGYPAVLPALLGMGVGAGLFTAPVVSAAVRAVPAERAGLASGVNNTARQTGTALGVAIFGARLAGASGPAGFTHRLGELGLLGGALWLAALVIVAMTTGSGPAEGAARR